MLKFAIFWLLALCALAATYFSYAEQTSENNLTVFDVSGVSPEYQRSKKLVTMMIPVPSGQIRALALQQEKAAWLQDKIGPTFPQNSQAKAKRNLFYLGFLWSPVKLDYDLYELNVDGKVLFQRSADSTGGTWTFFLLLTLFFLILPVLQRVKFPKEDLAKGRSLSPYAAIFRKEFWKSRIHVPCALILIACTLLMACFELYLWKGAEAQEGVIVHVLPPAAGEGFAMLDVRLNPPSQGAITIRADRAEMRQGHQLGSRVSLLHNARFPGEDYIFNRWYAIWGRTLVVGILAAMFSFFAVITCTIEVVGANRH